MHFLCQPAQVHVNEVRSCYRPKLIDGCDGQTATAQHQPVLCTNCLRSDSKQYYVYFELYAFTEEIKRLHLHKENKLL